MCQVIVCIFITSILFNYCKITILRYKKLNLWWMVFIIHLHSTCSSTKKSYHDNTRKQMYGKPLQRNRYEIQSPYTNAIIMLSKTEKNKFTTIKLYWIYKHNIEYAESNMKLLYNKTSLIHSSLYTVKKKMLSNPVGVKLTVLHLRKQIIL